MRPVEFAPQAIIEAGQALQAASRNITGFALRQKVGGGNPTRLKQVWDEHVASQSVTKVEPVSELPIEVAEEVSAVTKALSERLAALAVELNDKAVKAAERRVSEVIRTAGVQREQAERELVDAATTVDDLESTLEESKARIETLNDQLVQFQAKAQAQAVELAQVRERLAAAEQGAKAASEQHAAELARMNATIAAERTRHQQEAEQLRAELSEQKQTAKAAVAERDQARAELATVKVKAEAADKAHQEHRNQAATEAQRAAERMATADADRDAARMDAAHAREEAAKLRGQLEATQVQATELLRVIGQKEASARPTPAKRAPSQKTENKALQGLPHKSSST